MQNTIDIATLIAVVGSTFTILATMISLFLWLRTEANTDRRSIQSVQREDRKDLLQISRNIENTMMAIQQESKEFHNRLCLIERERK
jgi:chemotaxis protein CheY-P-specific phosphatase CheC